MFIPKPHLHTIARHHKCVHRKLHEVQDLGHGMAAEPCSETICGTPNP